MYINDLEDAIIHKGVGGVDISMLNLFIYCIRYAKLFGRII